MAPDIRPIERLKASAYHLYLALLPFTHARSESINAVSLKLQLTSYSPEEGVVAGHSGQFTPGGYLPAVIHTTLVSTRECKTGRYFSKPVLRF